MLIGLNGFAGSGKDTVAAIACREFGFRQYAFANKLKEMAVSDHDIVLSNGKLLSDVVREHGWEYAKWNPETGPETRVHLQDLGGRKREEHGESFWVDQVAKLIELDGVRDAVISDVRYPDEAAWVLDRGGMVVEVRRPGVEPVNDHATERRLPAHLVSVELDNCGTTDDLIAPLALLTGRTALFELPAKVA
ncbi:MAG: hypothetical protein M3Y35_17045 [Actinomycetota bacterium]|nr:hypothetical protein [Actinomycetota bacterium]